MSTLVKVGASQYTIGMNRTHDFTIGEYYHLYNRGTDKREIFLDVHDYHRFIMLLYLCNSNSPVDVQKLIREGRSFTEILKIERGEPLVAIGLWSLMPNHFHILVKEVTEGGITALMRKVLTGYSMYFNKKYNRSGNLFQGKFKSQHVPDDRYFQYLFSYVHLNPIKLLYGESDWKEVGIKDIDRAKKFLQQYKYSSLNDYIASETPYKKLLSKEYFPHYFQTSELAWSELLNWLSLRNVKVGASQV